MTYLFIFSNETNTILHCGYTADILKTVGFYNSMPSLLPNDQKLSRLIYLEIHILLDSAKERFNELNKMDNQTKLFEVKKQNPELIELMPGSNIEI